MDWQSLLWVGLIVALFIVMLRGCGGGGCGSGSRRAAARDDESRSADGSS